MLELNSFLWATIKQFAAIASKREGFVPPTVWPWKYKLEKNLKLLIFLKSYIAPKKTILLFVLYLLYNWFPYLFLV